MPRHSGLRAAVIALALLTAAAVGILLFAKPVIQDPGYHDFADHRTIWAIPNFWNVISNACFLIAAAWGFNALGSSSAFEEPWERAAYVVLLAGTTLVAFGSGYYHLHPDSQTLFWDRLPMTIVFMCLFSTTIGERISMDAGRRCLLPLLTIGVLSVIYWQKSGDLRLYGIVQFYPMIAIPLLLVLSPARYSGSGATFITLGLYLVAKILEQFDHQLSRIMSTGGHPWKHLASAGALACYVIMVGRRRPLDLWEKPAESRLADVAVGPT